MYVVILVLKALCVKEGGKFGKGGEFSPKLIVIFPLFTPPLCKTNCYVPTAPPPIRLENKLLTLPLFVIFSVSPSDIFLLSIIHTVKSCWAKWLKRNIPRWNKCWTKNLSVCPIVFLKILHTEQKSNKLLLLLSLNLPSVKSEEEKIIWT